MPNRTQNVNNIYHGEKILIDNQDFSGCQFNNCQVVYAGGELPNMSHCNFINSNFFFDDAAARTLILLQRIYHGMGDGGKKQVEDIFNFIRNPPQAPPASAAASPTGQGQNPGTP